MLVEWLIELVGAEDVVDALPASLSTGRKRAVAIARALAAQPEVVLYDEPTTMVDPIIARRLGALIQRLRPAWIHQHRGYARYALCRAARRHWCFSSTRAARLFFGPLKDFMDSSDPNIQQFLTLDAYILPTA